MAAKTLEIDVPFYDLFGHETLSEATVASFEHHTKLSILDKLLILGYVGKLENKYSDLEGHTYHIKVVRPRINLLGKAYMTCTTLF